MLVHVSRFQVWQARIKELIENMFNYYRRGIEQNIPEILKEMRDTFETDSNGYKSFQTVSSQILNSELNEIDPNIRVHKWDEVLPHLHNAASVIQIKEIHGGAADTLNYYDHKEGLSVIAIGGNKLSRGLTLEGLSVSYYLRASRMYDTLMQMGRWFGYHPGYVDLCRLFTSRELNEWYCHITLASEELRKEFNYMSEIAGSTPEQYALKVRTHPGVLKISATNKMRTAVNVSISWAGTLMETYKLSKDHGLIESNFHSLQDFIKRIPGYPCSGRGFYLWQEQAPNEVLGFLSNFRTPQNPGSEPSYLVTFIEEQIKRGELTSWRIALMNKENAKTFRINNLETGMFLRNQAEKLSDTSVYYLRKSHIISPKHEFIDLSEGEYKEALKRTQEMRLQTGKAGVPQYPNGNIVRNEFRKPQNPLLIIYLLDPAGAELADFSIPVVGFAISFPGSRSGRPVTYAVHKQLLPMFDIDIEFEDYDEDED